MCRISFQDRSERWRTQSSRQNLTKPYTGGPTQNHNPTPRPTQRRTPRQTRAPQTPTHAQHSQKYHRINHELLIAEPNQITAHRFEKALPNSIEKRVSDNESRRCSRHQHYLSTKRTKPFQAQKTNRIQRGH